MSLAPLSLLSFISDIFRSSIFRLTILSALRCLSPGPVSVLEMEVFRGSDVSVLCVLVCVDMCWCDVVCCHCGRRCVVGCVSVVDALAVAQKRDVTFVTVPKTISVIAGDFIFITV